MRRELQDYGYVRVAAVSPEMRIADVRYNTDHIERAMHNLHKRGVALAVFPELCITGYTCGDLFYQSALKRAAIDSLGHLAELTEQMQIAVIVGLPLEWEGRLYNVAAFLAQGLILGIVPKVHLPNAQEYYEKRWFTSGRELEDIEIEILGESTLLGCDLLFEAREMPGCRIGIELCEDLWAVAPPSNDLALAGATLLVNPSASNEVLGKAPYRRQLVQQQSARTLAAYVYASAGPGESSTDVVYSGHNLIAENGIVLQESPRFAWKTQSAIADIDLEHLLHERHRHTSYGSSESTRPFRIQTFSLEASASTSGGLHRKIAPLPFVPTKLEERDEHCEEIFAIQSTGLAQRLRHTGVEKICLGLSGGLDSTLALLVTARAFDRAGLSHEGITTVTMPGFGTTERTRNNAQALAELLGTHLRHIPIHEAVEQHFRDIDHPPDRHDVVYENAQARERTQILMDIANQIGGIVVGTGDLSEFALGWATYNGDHMSMYHVNAGVPKTLVRTLVEWCADHVFEGEVARVLHDICNTPITPELLPLGVEDDLVQKTEETIGPYELHDFFLFYVVRHGFAPRKILFLAEQAFEEKYTREEILRWMELFYRRFFGQQFKRSAMPDGPKVGSVALSPRGDWRMPSDASATLWIEEVAFLQQST